MSPLSRTAVRSGKSTGARSFGSYTGSVFATQPGAPPPSAASSTAEQTSALTLQRWITEHQITLQESQDKDALARLAQGDTSYFISYSERRLAEVQGNQDQTSYWSGLHDEAIQKAEDNYVAGAVASGELKLEDAMALMVKRRDRIQPGDAAFVAVNKQIAQIHNAIDARDFNTAVETAYQHFVDTGDKQSYVTALTGFRGLAKDDAARKTLDTQITSLRTEILKDEQTKAQAEVDKRFIDYYSNGKASDLLNFLSDKAGTAKSAAEANYYVDLAGKIVAREEALTKQRVSAAAAAGSPTAQKRAIDAALQPSRNDLADATDHLQSVIRNGQVPTAGEWAIFWAAGDKVIAGDQAAIGAGATTTNLDAVLKEQRTVIEARDIQKKAAGEQVLKKMDDIKTVIAKLAGDAKNTTGDTTTAADLAAKQIQAMRDLANSDFLKGSEGAVTAQEKITAAVQPFAAAYQDAITALTDPTQRKSFKQAQTLWNAYTKLYEQKIGDGKFVNFDEWQQAMASGQSADMIAQMLGLNTKDGTNNGFTQANVDAALNTRAAASAEKEQLVQAVVRSGKVVPDLIGQNSVALGLFGYAGGGRVVPGYNAPATPTAAGGGPAPRNASLIPLSDGTRTVQDTAPFDSGIYQGAPASLTAPYSRPVNDVAPADTGGGYNPYAPQPVRDTAPFDSGTYSPYASAPRPVQDQAPFDSGMYAPPPPAPGGGGYNGFDPGFSGGGASASPQSPDAASRNLDTILGTTPPAWQTAFDYLHADTPFEMPSWQVPDLPPEPSFLPSGGSGPSLDPGFTMPVPTLDQGGYSGDTTGVTHGH